MRNTFLLLVFIALGCMACRDDEPGEIQKVAPKPPEDMRLASVSWQRDAYLYHVLVEREEQSEDGLHLKLWDRKLQEEKPLQLFNASGELLNDFYAVQYIHRYDAHYLYLLLRTKHDFFSEGAYYKIDRTNGQVAPIEAEFAEDACFACQRRFRLISGEEVLLYIDRQNRLSRVPVARPELSAKSILSEQNEQVHQYEYQSGDLYAYISEDASEKLWLVSRQSNSQQRVALARNAPFKMWYDFDQQLYLLFEDSVRRFNPQQRTFTALFKVEDHFKTFTSGPSSIGVLYHPEKKSIHLYERAFVHKVYQEQALLEQVSLNYVTMPGTRLQHIFDYRVRLPHVYASALDLGANQLLLKSDLLGEHEVLFSSKRYEALRLAVAENGSLLFTGNDLHEGKNVSGLVEDGRLLFAATIPNADYAPKILYIP